MTVDIVYVHLLNDRSGSPRVLRQVIASLTAAGRSGKLYIGGGDGILDDVPVPTRRFGYRRSARRWATLVAYLVSQLRLFATLSRDRDIGPRSIIYVNTLLPFGAALFGRFSGRRVVYHVHEISLTPRPLLWALLRVVATTSSANIFVSAAHRRLLPVSGKTGTVVYNGFDDEFALAAAQHVYRPRRNGKFRILMAASLRDYKGLPEFLRLAHALGGEADIVFDLVLNEDADDVARFVAAADLPPSVTVHPRSSDMARFYREASLVLNLSRVDQWVETFGLTIVEAMAFGIPVIVPPVGGPTEIVRDGVDGYLVDSRQHEKLVSRVRTLAAEPERCLSLSAAARQRSAAFSPAAFRRSIVEQSAHWFPPARISHHQMADDTTDG